MCVADLCFLVLSISLGHRTYTGAGGYGDDNRYGGGSNRSWGGGIQTEDQSFDHKDNKSLYVRIHDPAADREVDHFTGVLAAGQTRPGPPRIQLAFQIRSSTRVGGENLQ